MVIYGSFILNSSAQNVIEEKKPKVYFETLPSEVKLGENVLVKIYLDTDVPINAVELSISYPKFLLKPIIFNDGQSIISLWQDRNWKNESGIINLTGGTPRAFAGTKGEIGRFTFTALKEGSSSFNFNSAIFYYADGKGTRVEAISPKKTITVYGHGRPQQPLSEKDKEVQIEDLEPPIFIVTDTLKNSTDGTRLAVFDVQDKGSGLSEVRLRTLKWFSWSDWVPVSNPTKLPSGIWKYQLLAIDNVGNENLHNSYILSQIIKVLILVILSFIFLIVARYFIIKR